MTDTTGSSRVSRTVSSTGTSTHTRYLTTNGGRVASAVVWWVRVWRWVVPVVLRALRFVRDTVTPAGWLALAALVEAFAPFGSVAPPALAEAFAPFPCVALRADERKRAVSWTRATSPLPLPGTPAMPATRTS